MPNCFIFEYVLSLEPVSRDVSTKYLEAEGGYIELPKEPGLGVDLDEAKLAQYPYKPFPPRPIRTVEDERRYH